MADGLLKTWTNLVQPLLRRPRQLQVAAICYRENNGKTEVLLITSRGTGRWIVPKGWPIDGLNAPEAALQEAWEEAGVKASVNAAVPVGSFDYEKWVEDGYETPIKAQVFKVRIDDLADTYPEMDERTREWFSPAEAANLVQEPGLQDILRHL
ncbi:Diadenosine hexaphosphate hydrolase [Roseovarius litorisediminis]|uniref:Diadenosine hexaphosphate hydrolase n=1 Tax=Roseovarius litorisediminis TaxID=1312363 RepID=A0A1Y5RNL0_9RHOB|nr:NUDIX hydrolase [Roseovarius litorisediminis]SLN21809.1 Diadenosine hexaphosphate hydrolase [Roseovarius litorisediminis]